jgi:predicted Rossmann-fold nucleotide-binding protein
MRYAAEVYLFFPGGFGTLDELAESLTLVQTGKINNVKLVLVGKEFWAPLESFIHDQMIPNALISPEDVSLYTVTDDEDLVIDIIKNAQERIS